MATHNNPETFKVGLAASVGAGISMGFAEALSDDGSLTGRGHPLMRGFVCGLMTALGGLGHTLPYLIPHIHIANVVAVCVVAVELGVISWVRHRFMDTPLFAAARVESGHPVHVDERRAREQLAAGAVEHIEDPVAIGMKQQLPHPAAPEAVNQNHVLA